MSNSGDFLAKTCLKLVLCYTFKKPPPRATVQFSFLSTYLTFHCHGLRAETQALFHTA